MFFSKIIIELTKQGKSPEYIVEYAQHPLITEKYINKVIKQFKRINKKYKWAENCRHMVKQSNPPKPNTISRMIYDKVLEMGFEVFHQKYKQNIRILAEQMQVPHMNLRRFFQGYFTGRLNHHPNYFAGTPWHVDTIHKYRKFKNLDKSLKPTTDEVNEMKKLF